MNSEKRYLWFAVTKDKYEFPIFVCDSAEELAEHFGTTLNNVRSSVSHAEREGRRGKYRRVRV